MILHWQVFESNSAEVVFTFVLSYFHKKMIVDRLMFYAVTVIFNPSNGGIS